MCFDHATSSFFKCQTCDDFAVCRACVGQARHSFSWESESDVHSFEEIRIPSLQSRFEEFQALALLAPGTGRDVPQEVEDSKDMMKQFLEIPVGCCFLCFDRRPETVEMAWLESSDHHVSSHGWNPPSTIYTSDLRMAASRGCAVCSLAFRGLLLMEPEAEERDSRISLEVGRDRLAVGLAKNGPRRLLSPWDLFIQGSMCPTDNPLSLPRATLLSPEFSSVECFDKIKGWIQSCETTHSHESCAAPARNPLPARVLSITGSVDSPSIRLHMPEPDTLDRYIALSHCWGKVPGVKTTSTNLQDHLNNLEMKTLPRTFQDAIYCALRLGIEYLWIDSLCIIQDDPVDWEIESSKMCDIFSQAHLVIVSASASGDHEDFLGTRPVAYQGIPFESSEGSGIFDAVVRREMPHTKTLDSGHRFPLAGSHIESRAWCMQETFLARRSVTFNNSEMVWECRSRAACEYGTMSEDFTSPNPQPRFRTGLRKKAGKEGFYWVVGPDHPSLHGAPRTFGPLVLGHSFLSPSHKFQYFTRPLAELSFDDDDGAAARTATYEEWRHLIVPMYTRRKLTYGRDRLPALSGLASAAALRCNDTYIAGLWKNDFKLGLLWSVEGNPSAPPSEYLAPPFSFASVNRPVVYNLLNRLSESGKTVYGSTRVKLLAVDLIQGRDPFGMVLGGSILVSGLSSKRRLILKEDSQRKGNGTQTLLQRKMAPKAHGNTTRTRKLQRCRFQTGRETRATLDPP